MRTTIAACAALLDLTVGLAIEGKEDADLILKAFEEDFTEHKDKRCSEPPQDKCDVYCKNQEDKWDHCQNIVSCHGSKKNRGCHFWRNKQDTDPKGDTGICKKDKKNKKILSCKPNKPTPPTPTPQPDTPTPQPDPDDSPDDYCPFTIDTQINLKLQTPPRSRVTIKVVEEDVTEYEKNNVRHFQLKYSPNYMTGNRVAFLTCPKGWKFSSLHNEDAKISHSHPEDGYEKYLSFQCRNNEWEVLNKNNTFDPISSYDKDQIEKTFTCVHFTKKSLRRFDFDIYEK
jgi:hypothetical protein